MSPDTTALVVALERLQQSPGTLPLFDALSVEDVGAVGEVLSRYARHPMRADVAGWLQARGGAVASLPSADAVCERRGIVDLDAHLDEAAEQVRRQGLAMERLLLRAQKGESVANAYAALLVVVAAIALLGWASALDYLAVFDTPPEEHLPASTPTPHPP
jgi:hypothetical protein